MKKKILISAYAISPFKGSEYAAAWNTIINLATQHELWVLYGISDGFMGDTQTMRQYIADNPETNIHFIEVRAGRIADKITLLDKAGFGWFFYFAYYLWQKEALRVARNIIEKIDIDVVHQLGPIGFREPGFLWQLDKPFVWGPIGGIKFIDRKLMEHMPASAQVKFTIKNYINKFQLSYSKRINDAFKIADVLIAATHSGQAEIKKRYNRNAYYLPEQGVKEQQFTSNTDIEKLTEKAQLVWCGSLIDRKNLVLCLEALAAVKQTNWELCVLGDGPLRKSLEKKADLLGIASKVVWHGHVERTAALKVISTSNLHIISSIDEDNPAVVFEAMSYGVPTLTIDHRGMGDVICSNCGIKILPDTHDKMVTRMAVVINHLLKNPQLLATMAKTTLQCAPKYNWDKRTMQLNGFYDEAIFLHSRREYYPANNEILVTA